MDKTAVKSGLPASGPRSAEAVQAKAPLAAISSNGDGLPATEPVLEATWKLVLEPISSLKLTVILFSLSLVIVFYGTWAQVDQGIWYVVSQYFRSWFVMIPIKVILFHSIEDSPFSIPFPGGWTIGALLLTNLLAAHAVRFKMTWKRSGIFILHAGLIIMFVGEFVTGMWAREGIMQIAEKQETNFTQDAHNAELAVIDVSDPKIDDTVAIPSQVLRRGGVIRHAQLPFDIELAGDYLANSVEIALDPDKVNRATAGLGKFSAVRAVPQVSGADPEQKFDLPAAYLTLKDKATGTTIDTYLVRMFWREQHVKLGGKTYEIALRPKRTYRPFSVYLDKAHFKTYPGTEKPKDYSSIVIIKDQKGTELRRQRIYMNHPLYYDGEVYFQSSMEVRARPIITGLQVVRNPSSFFIGDWRISLPLISLTMVGVGMLIHFGMHLISFLQRRVLT